MEAIYHSITMDTIDSNSLWITATPSPTTLSFPFYIMEAGHFLAHHDYALKREHHNSFLLLYTLNGKGTLHSSNTTLELTSGSCVIIDCHTPHEYYTADELWDFMWIHFEGNGVRSLVDILYPTNMHTINIKNPLDFEQQLNTLLKLTTQNDIVSCLETSAKMHMLFHILLQSSLEHETDLQKGKQDHNITAAIKFIQTNYSHSITIEDIIQDIPISKYHFIRCFRRIMGVTPYNYLTNYRINKAKILLRTTENSIAAIAEACGFLDTSNFIVQFKKLTGVRPTQYRRDFTKLD